MMVKTGRKRKVSGGEEVEVVQSPRKKLPVENQVVSEFVKMANVKQTRLKGLTRFLKTLKEPATPKHEIILKYLQNHPECLELFQILDERIEERSLLEVQVVLEILETIILHMAEEDTRIKSKSTAIITKIFTKHKKLVYNSLNPSSPVKLMAAMLKLLTAIVMQGSPVAKEMLTTFDFSHKTFSMLVNHRDKKDIADVRTCCIKFLMSFFITGDPPLIQQVLQIKGFATSIFKNLNVDSPEVIHLVLTTLLVKVVQNSSILKKTKILLFTSYSLTQLVRLYSYSQDNLVGQEMSVRDEIHQFLLELCTSQGGIAFENKLGIFSARSNNPVLLRFLHSLPKTIRDDLLVELVIKILVHSQDLISPYLSGCQMALEPRNSEQWSRNVLFLIKLYFLLPLPSSAINSPAVSLNQTLLHKLLLLVCPVIVKRNVLTRGLMHANVVVQTTTLSMMLVILRRCVDLTQCLSMDHKILAAFREEILKVLPSLQILISIRESLVSKTRTTEKQLGLEKDSPAVISVEGAKSLLSRTLAVMHLYQVLLPNCFSQDSYDPWKLLPRSEDENLLYNPSSKHSMLQILLNAPSRVFKWHPQAKVEGFLGFHQILKLYCNTEDDSSRRLAKEVLRKLLYGTGAFDVNEEEVSIWLHNIIGDCLEKSEAVLTFFEKVCCVLANDPYDLVDTVMESVGVAILNEESQSTVFENICKSSMPFSPLVAGALKLFSQMMINEENRVEEMADDIGFIGRFLNLVFLDLLQHQRDPRALCHLMTKYLVQDDLVKPSVIPSHTKVLLRYLMQWCPMGKESTLNDDQQKVSPKKIMKKQGKRRDLSLIFKQLEKQLPGTVRSLLSVGENGDIGAALVTFLKYNPVSLFDYLSSTELVKSLNGLPCYLILQQLLMFESNFWVSGTEITDSVKVWDTFEQLSAALLSSIKHENIELWDQTVSSCLFLMSNLVRAYLRDSKNERIFLEINRKTVEVLRTVFQRLKEEKYDVGSSSDVLPSESGGDEENDDVMSFVDVASQSKERLEDFEDIFSKCLKMVFSHHVFKDWFCFNTVQHDKHRTLSYVSAVVSSWVAELMSTLQTEILADKDEEFWQPYFLRIVQVVKERARSENKTSDTILPFDLPVTSLLKLFCNRFPPLAMSETILTFLDLPRDEFVESVPMDVDEETGHRGNRLTDTGKTFVTLLDCFLSSKEKTGSQACITSEALQQIFELLTWLDCQETDELFAKAITSFSNVSEQTNVDLLLNCLDHPTAARVDTVVMLLCNQPSIIKQFEQRLVSYHKGRRKELNLTNEDELQFLEVKSLWIIFLPLLNFYLSSLKRGDANTTSKRIKKCVEYIGDVSWPVLKEWLLDKTAQKYASECFQLISCLLEVQEIESDTLQMLFNDVTQREHSLNWDLYQVQAVASLLQSILKRLSNEKEERKYRTVFVFGCMERLTKHLKNHCLQGEETLRLKILYYLEDYGKGPLKLKTNKHFTSEAFMDVTNTFIKTVLRFSFSCGQTMSVLSVIVKTVYESDSKKASLLMPLTDLYQFILSHSKFLEIFLENSEIAKQNDICGKCALINLLQTVVHLEPKCCNSSHFSLFLGAYGAKRCLCDKKLLRLLFTYEAIIGELVAGSRVLWGEAAIESYKANKEGHATLWHQPSIAEVLDLLDSKLLLQSAKHFPIYQHLQPVVLKCEDEESQFYDPSFLLPLFSYFMAPDCEVNCRKFVDRAGLAYTICGLTSTDQRMRQVAYQILSRFLLHLSASRFKEKQQVSHLLHCFQNGIVEANARISSLITSFMTRALHIFFYPEDPLYISVNSYMLQKAFMDLREVPLFLSLINSGDLEYRTERTWLLHLLMDGLRDPMDYYICKKYHVFQQLFTLYSCSVADKYLQKLILKVLRQVCHLHAPVYDLCYTYGLVPWLHLLVTNPSTSPDAVELVLDILGLIWFTLIGQEVSRDDKDNSSVRKGKEESSNGLHVPLPKNICSQLLLVCLSILLKNSSLEVWDQDTFVAFVRLLASLLQHQDKSPSQAKVTIKKHHAVQITNIWNSMFSDVDILDKLIDLLNRDSCRISEKHDIRYEKWFLAMSSVVRIINRSTPEGLSEKLKGLSGNLQGLSGNLPGISRNLEGISRNLDMELPLYACLPRPVHGKCIKLSLETHLRHALRVFTEPDFLKSGFDEFRTRKCARTLEDLIF